MIRRRDRIQEKLSLPILMAGAVCFWVAVILIFGSLRLYELQRENQAQAERIGELQEQVGALRNELACQEHEALQRAAEMGMILPGQEDYVILHVGR